MRNGRLRLNGGPQLTWGNMVLTLTLLGGLLSAIWIVFQTQITNLGDQTHQRLVELNAQILENHNELDRLRDRTLSTADNKEIVKRLDQQINDLTKRLDIIETTRPTTGELQSAAASIKDQIGEIKERLRFLEQSPRAPLRVETAPIPAK